MVHREPAREGAAAVDGERRRPVNISVTRDTIEQDERQAIPEPSMDWSTMPNLTRYHEPHALHPSGLLPQWLGPVLGLHEET